MSRPDTPIYVRTWKEEELVLQPTKHLFEAELHSTSWSKVLSPSGQLPGHIFGTAIVRSLPHKARGWLAYLWSLQILIGDLESRASGQ